MAYEQLVKQAWEALDRYNADPSIEHWIGLMKAEAALDAAK